MLLSSLVTQITQIQLSTNSHFWIINWKPHIEIFPAATLHLYNMADKGEKLQQLHCYHQFSDSRDTYLTKNHCENYSPNMVPTNPTGSWTIWSFDDSFVVSLNKLSKEQRSCRWFEVLLRVHDGYNNVTHVSTTKNQHIEVPKWRPFCRQHFRIRFLYESCYILSSNTIENLFERRSK